MPDPSRFALAWSKYLSWGFAAIIIFFMTLSELFQFPTHPPGPLSALKEPVQRSIIERLSSLRISNHLGSYELTKRGHSWQITEPRNLRAQNHLVERIISSLSNLKVRKIYQRDKINLQNFSLHRPTVKVVLRAFEQVQELKFGLFNSIDNSTYIVVDESPLIYQVDLFNVAIQSLSLSDFVNSNIFQEPLEKITQIRVKRHRTSRKFPELTLIRKQKQWANRNGRPLNQERIQEILSKLLAKKVELILDDSSQKREQRIAHIIKKPAFVITIYRQQAKVSYKISPPLHSLPELKLEKKKFVLITSSQATHPALADKSILDLLNQLNTRSRKLKTISPKKLFY